MENENLNKPFKLDIKRTCIIGFAFFGILLLWQVYDSWCSIFAINLLKEVFPGSSAEDVSYLAGVMMAMDNLAALILLPIFGKLSDKTNTKIGKRMPFILIGTFVSAVVFPLIPIFYHYHNIIGYIITTLIVVCFMMMYRNPAVSLMPDLTPKPLRSKANGIINIMGYIGGAFATVIGMIFVLTTYLGTTKDSEGSWQYKNIWAIEAPFLIASVLMVISALVLFFCVKENKIKEEIKDELARGEEFAAIENKIDDDKPMTKANKTMLILILVAEFFWFMADNGISTFMTPYTVYYLKTTTFASSINIIVGGLGSVIGFALGGLIAEKIGRKWSVASGLILTLFSYLLWAIATFTFLKNAAGSGNFPYLIYIVWFIKGFGMSLVHINSFPMVVELCSSKKIGAFTGYYYASSMVAQTITPIALGLLLKVPNLNYSFLPVYASVCVVTSIVVFMFVKNVKINKVKVSKGLEAFDQED